MLRIQVANSFALGTVFSHTIIFVRFTRVATVQQIRHQLVAN